MQKKIPYALLGILLIPCWIIAAQYNIDLVNLYAAAGFTHTDLSRVYAFNENLGRYFYGPFSLVLISPLAHLSFTGIKIFWIILQTLSYGIFWYALYQLYPVLKEKKFLLSWLLIWIVSINPIHNNFQSNNIQLMLAAALLLAELKTRQDSAFSQGLAGILVAFCSMIKVFPFFIAVFYLLVKPRWVKAGVLLGLVLATVLPFLFFGFDNGFMLHREFLSNLSTYSHENSLTRVSDILCLPSMITRILSPGTLPPEKWVESIAKGATLLFSAVFFLWVSLQFLKHQLRDPRYSLHVWAFALAMMVFLNPSSRPHYFIFYIPIFCSVLELFLGEGRKSFAMALVWTSTLLIAFTTDFFIGKSLNDTLEFKNIPTVGFILVIFALMLGLRAYPIKRENPAS